MNDLIKRADVIKVIRECRPWHFCELVPILSAIKDIPTAEFKYGNWESVYKYKLHARPTCTVCGYDGEDEKYGRISNRIVRRFHFCPNCGADMRKGADDE